jgi:carbon-monoxide dehydrogenase medium subunit
MNIAFHRPQSVAEACGLLAKDEGARPLAGGQTLVAMLNLGLLQPSAIVSLADIAELRGLRRLNDGSIYIGAMTTHAEIAASPAFVAGQGLITHAAGQIAEPAVRNFGTIGGACAHGDPASDWPTALVAAGAVICLEGARGGREVAARDFFQNLFTTSLETGELVAGVRVPPLRGRGVYRKLARVDGDYATVAVAVVAAKAGDRCTAMSIAVGACGPRPCTVAGADEALKGRSVERSMARASGAMLAEAIEPLSDVRGSAAYRRRVLPEVVADTVMEALS